MLVGRLAVFFILIFYSSMAGAVTFSWDYDPAGDTGTHLGFRLYYDSVSHASATDPDDLSTASPYANRIEITDPDARTYQIDLPDGTYYFRINTYGTVDGQPGDSAFNQPELTFVVDTTPPPTGGIPSIVNAPVVMNWGINTDPAGQSITIPSEANAVLFFWSYWRDSNGYGLGNVTLAGTTPDEMFELEGTQTFTAIGMAIWYNPASGVQTLDPVWDGNPDAIPPSHVVFLKDAIAGVRDVGGAQGDASGALSTTIDSEPTDLVIRFDVNENSMPGTQTGWTSQKTSALSYYNSRVSIADAAGSPTTTANSQGNEDFYTMLVVSIPGGAVGVQTLSGPTNFTVTQ